jgi:ABC-2 type transport system ATP-binding protein
MTGLFMLFKVKVIVGLGSSCYNPHKTMTVLIETLDLSKSFGDFHAVEGVTLQVGAGEVLALLGPNGAGKTTTIRMLASILVTTRGWAKIAGFDVVQDPVAVRSCIGMLTEHHGLYTRMRAHEYLEFFGQVYGMPLKETNKRIDEILTHLEMVEDSSRRLGEFSKGMRQKLALARTMLHDPAILLLDEPTSAMDPSSAKIVRENIFSLRSSKRAIVVCTHNLGEAEILADRIAIIQNGKIVAQGKPDDLKRAILGNPIMQVELSQTLNGVKPTLPPQVKIIEYGNNWIRYEVANPNEMNPKVIDMLSASGFFVVTLTRVGRSLEEVYLRVVRDNLNRTEFS